MQSKAYIVKFCIFRIDKNLALRKRTKTVVRSKIFQIKNQHSYLMQLKVFSLRII